MYRGKKISIAMATYNGERFLAEQLQSILNQTVLPDEIIICDDGSSDGTLTILDDYCGIFDDAGAELHIIKNEENLGFARNFEQAILLSSGDYIFLCDQDDIWETTKIQEMVDVFAERPETELVMHDADQVDAGGIFLTEEHFFEGVISEPASGYIERVVGGKSLSAVVSGPIAAGMTMCLSREFAHRVLPFNGKYLPLHDHWLQFCAICDNQAILYKRKLACHRIHGGNVTGSVDYRGSFNQRITKLRNRLQVKEVASIWGLISLGTAMVEYMEQHDSPSKEAIDIAYRLIEIGEAQIDAFSSGRITGAHKLMELYNHNLRYRRCGKGNYYVQLLLVCLHSKRERLACLGCD